MSASPDERIGARLRRERDRLGLTLSQVAKQLGLNSYQTLGYIEKGSRPVKVSELAKLAKIYSRPINFFFEHERAREKPIHLAWRERQQNEVDAQFTARINKWFDDYLMLERLDDERSEFPMAPWPEDTKISDLGDVGRIAERTVEELRLGRWPARELRTAMEELVGVRVIFQDLGDRGSAVSVSRDGLYMAIVNSRDSAGRRHFSLAHELFHVLGSRIYPPASVTDHDSEDQAAERFANVFASVLLMPEMSIRQEFSRVVKGLSIEMVDFIRLSRQFQVSSPALLWRLHNLGLVQKEAVTELLSSRDFTQLDKSMRDPEREMRFSRSMVILGLRALVHGRISKGRFCDIFEIERSSFGKFLQDWGFDENIVYAENIQVAHP